MKTSLDFKTSSKALKIGLAALAFMHAIPLARGNGEGSGGGSVIKDKAGNYYPADLDRGHNMNQLPYPSSSEIKFDQQMPELHKKLLLLTAFLNLRFDDHIGLDPGEFSFYATESFSGEDKNSIIDSNKQVQVAYTYRFIAGRDQKYAVHKVIELGPLFFKQDIKIQALIILHEMLHHQKNGVHSKIAPLIAGLFKALPVIERQLEQKNYSPMSENEWQGLVNLDTAMADFAEIPFDEGRFVEKNGGGIIVAKGGKTNILKRIANSNNFISLSSRIFLNLTSDKAADFENNIFIDSNLAVKVIKNCTNNKITASRFILRCETSKSVLSKVQAIRTDSLTPDPSELILKGREIELNQVTFGGDIILEGFNKLINVFIMGGDENNGITLNAGVGFKKSKIKFNALKNGIQLGFSKPRNYSVIIEGLNIYLSRDIDYSPRSLKILVDSRERAVSFDLCTEYVIDIDRLQDYLPWRRYPVINLKDAEQLSKDLPHSRREDCSWYLKQWDDVGI